MIISYIKNLHKKSFYTYTNKLLIMCMARVKNQGLSNNNKVCKKK